MATRQERLIELLADRALVGLDAQEQIELAQLLIEIPGASADHFERAAAAVALADLAPLEALPAGLAARIEQDALNAALRHTGPGLDKTQVDPVIVVDPSRIDSARSGRPAPQLAQTFVMPDRPPTPSQAPTNVVPFERPTTKAPSRAFAVGGWIAAAACLLLAIGAVVFQSRRTTVSTVTPPPSVSTIAPVPTPPVPPAPVVESPAALREKLLASAGSARADWSATKDPASKGASGDVVWNAAEQKGTMRFRGLAKNDPARAQYQLWIFDKNRDDKYPVDGGVFDVDDETGDVVVTIKATLPVATPVLFAVTVEKPGGVVVSKRERIVVTAKLPAG
ncbi:MAG: anti-sigma factor [Labilithrix sp.]|nr:anti-sigma factor [Labilithrix sp.]